METARLSEIKRALSILTHKEILNVCLRLAKYRKENKELISYLIFDAHDPAIFIKQVKEEIDFQFSQMNLSSIYLAKKTIRKVLSTTNKYIKFAGSKQTEVELLIYFCQCLKNSGLPFKQYPVTENLYNRQLLKIKGAMQSLHEDLQFDYGKLLEKL
jgi:hypothetical protein